MNVKLSTAMSSATYSHRPWGFPDYQTATIADADGARLIATKQATAVAPAPATAVAQGVTYVASANGVGGNTISLVYNGTTDTVTSVTTAWNDANPTKLVTFSGKPGTFKPTASTVTLAGGLV